MEGDGDVEMTPLASVENHDGNGLNQEQDTSLTNGASERKSGESKSSSKEGGHSSSDKHRSSSSSHHKSSRHKSEHRDKDGHRSSSSKHSSSGDKHRSSSSSSKHHSSSSHSRDKSSSSSSHKDKHRDKDKSSSSSSHRDGEKKHSSSSSSSKPHSSSSSSDKHRSGDKDKHSSSSSKDRHSSSSSKDRHSSSHKSSRSDKDKPSEKDKRSSSGVENDEPPAAVVKSEPTSPVKAKPSPKPALMSDDDMPLADRVRPEVKSEKRPIKNEDSDDEPLASRMEKKIKKEKVDTSMKKRKQEEDSYSPVQKKKKKEIITPKRTPAASPTKKGKKGKKEEVPEERWRWWEEENRDDGAKWQFLEHKGPVFAVGYDRLPKDVHFIYDGKPMKLSQDAEEVAGFFGRMIDHDYTTKKVFQDNFFKDWRKVMSKEEKEKIKDLSKCNFTQIDAHFKRQSEERKARSREEKKAIKAEKDELIVEYGYCLMDGHKEKIANFNIEPPGLFRGRGNHPKQGMLKRRVMPEDIIINCSRKSVFPEPPPGHKWKEIRHDNTVSWLCNWVENVQNQGKYIMLGATSRLKGEKDWKKYEVARLLHTKVDKIRAGYREDLKSKEMRIRQRAVAMYFIDKLALRAGNEKDEDTADTVGCCSLRYEHITLHDEQQGKQFVVEFDFLGKDSIRYHNAVPVDKRVYKNLKMFMENKSDGDDLFDRLNTSILNKHLTTLMEGLTAKVFRTYNASRTLQEQLDLLTVPDDAIPAKILAYNRANRSVAVLCNHQRAIPKTFDKQMENMNSKIDSKKDTIKEARKEYKQAKSDYKAHKSEKTAQLAERKKKTIERLEDQLTKLEISLTDKDENKDIALGTSKLNYLDPRITVAWCKKWEVPMEKVYNKTLREKFAWAIDMAEADYKFTEMDDE